ncbi:GNAT family N-acetyltransferase [Clostridium butyricum]|uniref:GCN5-related N-acetyltransferase n=1 Tax=Clostridium butyricum E4 str. BoNT E BL5262 TaxID=632245 RepID=C4IGQ9_CLOBU|nr:GNAT family N-acetyltransferase [Clostridium butyricum]APF24504.1 FR47-like family protein [Clostridium butyricum]EDT73394.1 acetyltransferase, gnat family [Clostridium butyricum 5521]EEP53886.1 GCN5-related N-acetyltransferase [Clostridium butyricum E4 str. BoNT E BL5262]NFL32715.1 GNAT family N-acetyltransferase [Clostridium butyricum]NFS20185.1 GNAT family N-acetyltransferase [Clostridium butyricum]
MKKDKAIKYLRKNILLNIGMIEPIRRCTAEILYAEIDGVLIREKKSNAYMISVDDFEIGRKLIDTIEESSLIVSHQQFMVDYILNRFKLTKSLECVQAVYMSRNKLPVKKYELEINKLKVEQIKLILEHYYKLSINEIEILLKNGKIFGGYKNGKLIGFVGNHLEGSIGLLEVFPQYRCLGYGTILESYIINKMIDESLVPFAQIEIDNKESMILQTKLGFEISKDCLYWIF